MEKWIKRINTSPRARKKSECHSNFGSSITDLTMDMKSNVPLVVVNICSYIENHGIKSEGLFRVNGSAKTIEQYKNLFKTSNGTELNAGNPFDIHALAGLLKLFLRELKNGLIPERYAQELIKIYPCDDTKKCIEYLIHIINMIPFQNSFLLNYILKFLVKVLENEPKNLMSSKSLGIIFGPCVFRCSITAQGLAIQGFLNHLMTILLEYYQDVFANEFKLIFRKNCEADGKFKSLQPVKKQFLPRRESVGVLLDCTKDANLPPSSSLFDLAANLIKTRADSIPNSKENSKQNSIKEIDKCNSQNNIETDFGVSRLLAKDIASIITRISKSNHLKNTSLDSVNDISSNLSGNSLSKPDIRAKKISYPFIDLPYRDKMKDDLTDEVWQVMIVGTENSLNHQTNPSKKQESQLTDEINGYRDQAASNHKTENTTDQIKIKTPSPEKQLVTEKSDDFAERMDFVPLKVKTTKETPDDLDLDGKDFGAKKSISSNLSTSSSSTSVDSANSKEAKCQHEGIEHSQTPQSILHHSYSMITPGISQNSPPNHECFDEDRDLRNGPSSLEEFSVLLEQVLEEQRNRCKRPTNIEDMTWEQVEKEKTDLQKGLLYFERIYGHPHSYHSKKVMKAFYDRYRIVKQLVAIHNLQKNDKSLSITTHRNHSGSTSRDTHSKHSSDDYRTEFRHKPSRMKCPNEPTHSPDIERKSLNRIASLLQETSAKFSQRILQLDTEGLKFELSRYSSHKYSLQKKLCAFEMYIEKEYGRKPIKTDRDTLREDYNNYRTIKQRIASLSHLLNQTDIDQQRKNSDPNQPPLESPRYPAFENFDNNDQIRMDTTHSIQPMVHLRRREACTSQEERRNPEKLDCPTFMNEESNLTPDPNKTNIQAHLASSANEKLKSVDSVAGASSLKHLSVASNYDNLTDDFIRTNPSHPVYMHYTTSDSLTSTPKGPIRPLAYYTHDQPRQQLHFFQHQPNPIDQRKVFNLYEQQNKKLFGLSKPLERS